MAIITRLDIWDYVVGGIIVVLSTTVGVYHAYKAHFKKATNVSTFLVRSPSTGLIPVTISAVASQLSAIGILGGPSEVYKHGIVFATMALAAIIAIVFGVFLYLPVFHNAGTNIIFQYLELRFNRTIRRGASAIDSLCKMFNASIVLYAAAVALNQVTGLHIWTSVFLIGSVCIGYTSLGGIKAVIWADVGQLFVILAVTAVILMKSSLDLGGIAKIWEINKQGGRTEINVDKHSYYTPWNTFVGGVPFYLSVLITNPMYVQRYMARGDLRSSRLSFSGSCIGIAFGHMFFCLAGVFAFAKYHHCDPLLGGQMSSRDQIMALFSMETLSFLAGLRGVFIASILCATLSTLSSLLNTMVVTIIDDFVRPSHLKISERNIIRMSKLLVAACGILIIAMVAAAENIAGLIPAMLSIQGMFLGPLFGVFTAGMLLPWINVKGALVGYVAAVGFIGWATLGVMITKPKTQLLPFSTDGCNSTVVDGNWTYSKIADTLQVMNGTESVISGEPFFLYTFSPTWYVGWGCGIVLIIGLLCSLIFGSANLDHVPPQTLFPIVRKIIIRLPKRMRKLLGFSTDHAEHLKKWDYNKEIEMKNLHEPQNHVNRLLK